jgi:hypothetical protein
VTVLVGVACADGIVIGADSAATTTAGLTLVVQLPTDKIFVINDRIIIAGTGAVGLGQRFEAIVRKAWSDKHFQKNTHECTKILATQAMLDFKSKHTPFQQGQGFGFGALMATVLDGQAQLVEFQTTDLQPELKRGKLYFVSMGSGQALAEPFLAFINRVLWRGQAPDVRTAMFGIYWSLLHTIEYAPYGVGHPISLAVLRKDKGDWRARLLEEAELQEQAQHIAEIEALIARYPSESIAKAAVKSPPNPPIPDKP